ncbi:ATP-binding protein [Derxia gummosa]|uniref:histidine kinase n=1 Tax=Derxia gummosa DSM 723 TaxID=1121388 RepID=A0A8B6X839_9BURK|nr:ATP-binding protein [Derxia gummosa]
MPEISPADATDPCAREPIRTPGAIQPHGALMLLGPPDAGGDRDVLSASINLATLLGLDARPTRLGALPDGVRLAGLLDGLDTPGGPPFTDLLSLPAGRFQLDARSTPQGLLLEFEPAGDVGPDAGSFYRHLGELIDAMGLLDHEDDLCRRVATETRRLTGFARVLIYRFAPDWHGRVVAEDGDGRLPSYLGLRFPASDIPAQARELYRRHRLRLIPDADYAPVPLDPPLLADGSPIDLGPAGLRSVAPVHVEYMRNMGTAASMSVSLLVDGALWGLISCHHPEPKTVAPPLRALCDFLGQLLALQIGARTRGEHAARRLALKRVENELLARVARAADFPSGLAASPEAWLGLVNAAGAAVVVEGAILTAGRTPPIDRLRDLAGWLKRGQDTPLWHTDALARHWPEAADLGESASGLLAIAISQLHASWILWFRPELPHSVDWGGDPRKPAAAPGERLSPRKSFDLWREQVRGQSEPWHSAELDAAADFRHAIVSFVLRQAEERAALTDQLQRSNKELESFSYSVSHDLRAPFRHIVGYAELLRERHADGLDDKSRHYLDNIIDSALSAGRLVDDLLNFSRLGRASLDMTRVDMNKLVAEVKQSLAPDTAGRAIDWRIAPLPDAWGDAAMLRQALANLIDNAVKYTRDASPAVIEIGGEALAHELRFWVRDNGTGFDMAYVGKLFGVFQRLHRAEDYAGTGIGLALTRRIIDRHGGRIDASGALGQGACFRFALPVPSLSPSPEPANG